MKLFVVVLSLAAAAVADKLDNTYLPPSSAQTAGGSGSFLNTPLRQGGGGGAAPGRIGGGGRGGGAASGGSGSYSAGPAAAPIGIVRLNNENNGDGTYRFDFETENRITAEESGQLKNVGGEEINAAQGSFSFAAPDGATYSISYTADENGFQPQGAHLPTAPPIPAEILKALEQNAADEAAGIVDDGQYRAEHEGEGAGRGGAGAGGAFGGGASNQYLAPNKPASNQQGGGQAGYRY